MGVVKEDYAKGAETSEGVIMSLSDLRGLLTKALGNGKKMPAYDSVLVKVQNISQVKPVENQIKTMGYSTESMESIRNPWKRKPGKSR